MFEKSGGNVSALELLSHGVWAPLAFLDIEDCFPSWWCQFPSPPGVPLVPYMFLSIRGLATLHFGQPDGMKWYLVTN